MGTGHEDTAGWIQVGVYNKAGEIVFRQQSATPIHDVSEVRSMTTLSKGEYYVIIQEPSNVITGKLIVQ